MNKANNKYIVYVGTYTSSGSEGIYLYNIDTAEGKLEQASSPVKADNPSYLAVSKNSKYLYAALESESFDGVYGGRVASYSIDRHTGELRFINTQSTKGKSPCHVSVDSLNEYLFAANYGEGTVSVFPINDDGSIALVSHVAVHKGAGPDKERQEGAHTHYVKFTPDERYIYAVDLGIDQVKLYGLDRAKGCLVPDDKNSLKLNPGSGPRHMEFHANGRYAYIINELDCNIVTLNYSSKYHCFDIMQCISSIPKGYKGTSYGGAIHISPDGRFLYVSNRGHDIISVFSIDDMTGMLEMVSFHDCGGKWPRDFAIDPTGRFLYVANQRSDTLAAFKINRESGELQTMEWEIDIASPVCIKFACLK